MLEAVMTGHRGFQPVIDAIIQLAERAAKDPRDFVAADKASVFDAVDRIAESELRAAYKITVKQERYAAVDAVKAKVNATLLPEGGEAKFTKEQVAEAFHDLQAKVVRWNILDDGVRIDGHDLKTVRPISSEVGVLPRAHGSALFTRGETQALVVATLGTGEDEQFVNSLEGTYKERFLLHYNFPPLRGETGDMGCARSPGDWSRQIGVAGYSPHFAGARGVSLYSSSGFGDRQIQRLLVDGFGVRSVPSANGRGGASEAPHRRHRDGPHPRRRALRGAVRHSRRRGSSRRHGLQSGGHPRRRDFAANGHQDRRDHRRDYESGAGAGARWPSTYSWRDGQGDRHFAAPN